MAVAIAADGVLSQDPDRAESAAGAADRGHPPKPEPVPTNLPPPEVTLPVADSPEQITPPPEPVKKPARHKKPQRQIRRCASNGTPAVRRSDTCRRGDPPNLRQGDR